VSGLDDFAALDAAGADVLAHGGLALEDTQTLNVGAPATLVAAMGVAHGHTPARALGTDFTHSSHVVAHSINSGAGGLLGTWQGY
jgi:hypothetical protein